MALFRNQDGFSKEKYQGGIGANTRIYPLSKHEESYKNVHSWSTKAR